MEDMFRSTIFLLLFLKYHLTSNLEYDKIEIPKKIICEIQQFHAKEK